MLKVLNNNNELNRIFYAMDCETKMYKWTYSVLLGYIDGTGIKFNGITTATESSFEFSNDYFITPPNIFEIVKKEYLTRECANIIVDDIKKIIYIKYKNGSFEVLFGFESPKEITKNILKEMLREID